MNIDLGRREKMWLALGLIILAPLITFRFILSPINEYQTQTEQKIINIKEKTSQINLLGQELLYLKRNQIRSSFSIRAKVDTILRKLNIKTKTAVSTEESQNKNQKLLMKMKDINLTELSRTIYQIENSKPIILIDKIDIIRSYTNDKLFRVSIYLSGK